MKGAIVICGITASLCLIPCARATARPATPTGLYVIACRSGKLCLYWNAVPGAKGYLLYRSLKSGKEDLLKPSVKAIPAPDSFKGSPMKWWVDRGLKDGREYFYRVRAVGKDGQWSDVSQEDSDFVDPTGTPWDSRDAKTIVAHVSREAERGDPEHEKIRSTDEFQVIGPDGMNYGRSSGGKYSQQPSTPREDIAFPGA